MLNNEPKDKAVDHYTLELDAPSEPAGDNLIRCIATNTNDDSTAETWLNLVQANALLSFVYGNEQSIVAVMLDQVADHRYAELIAQPGGRIRDRCVVSSEELLRFGFNHDELRPWKDEKE
jgi:hypothetical protein